MKFSIVIPARNEEHCIHDTLMQLTDELKREAIDYEVLVIVDHCTDSTEQIVGRVADRDPRVLCVENLDSPGFGMAVRAGLDRFSGDAVAIYMADSSDSPQDAVRYFRCIEEGAECAFGSRFMKGSPIENYPRHKLYLNRLANWFIRLIFRHGYNDTTNAFKCYRREVIDGCRPFLAPHFNLTVELPLKAFIRGYRYEIISIGWRGRTGGASKLKIKEMGSRYFFIVLYCCLEKLLTGKDYHRTTTATARSKTVDATNARQAELLER